MAPGKTAITLAKIEERLKNLLDSNGKEHKEIVDSIKELSKHVNEENQKMDSRITTLERHDIASAAERKAIKRTLSIIVASVTIVSTAIGILVSAGVI